MSEIVELDRLDLAFDPVPPEYSRRHRAAIEAQFARMRRDRPSLWNGRILMLADATIGSRALSGRFVETDFATLLWVLYGESTAPGLRNAFGAAALRGCDGGFVLVRQAPWTLNAGRVYFATGTPEPADVTADGQVDMEASMLRELAEETGLTVSDVAPAAGWLAVCDPVRIALLRPFVAHESAVALAARIHAFIARQPRPEIDGTVIVHGPEGLSPAMPDFIQSYLRAVWEREKKGRDFSD
ncbi:NUDIX hydrolase [Ancylobacter pratisalsi]|uniref:NUDIX hydrolase n=1 Tax=Ancylobacter pratisalsi TaxID=1745854 RepID=A0A6P1YHJ6_9HYPH|nr:NUDIX hydrolase [Ancylobacter pratisalsi]QIB32565.1 NUDIX hydrolase [Ancylobacter pratisalsi]